MLTEEYANYVESLTLDSPELYEEGAGRRSNGRRQNPSGWGSKPGYNSDSHLGRVAFPGTVQDVEIGIVPLTDEASRVEGTGNGVASAENPCWSGMRSRNPNFRVGDTVRVYHGPDNVSELLRITETGIETSGGNDAVRVKPAKGRGSEFLALTSDLIRSGNESSSVVSKYVNPGSGSSRMARNPQESSAALYETFHQKAPERIDEYEEHVHYHGWLAELGEMREIKVDLVYMDPPKQATIEFEPGTKLGCSEDGRQLYLVGGDQSLDLKALGFSRDWIRDYMLIGVLSELTYRTKKGFDKFEVIDYYHEVGEDTGDLPILAYDNMNQQLMIVGGKYRVEHDGIIN